MHIACPQCGAELEWESKPPSFCSECGKALTKGGAETRAYEVSPDSGEAPQTVAGYRLGEPLGRGGMGTVYDAEEIATGRSVALKLLAGNFAASEEAVDRFRREGSLAATLAHPRCVFVMEADEHEGRPFIVMERMPGDTLEDLIDREGPLPPAEAVAKILDVIEGLEQAHKLGIIHRDVKPSNCFVEKNGRVKIGDFGLSKSLLQSHHLTRTGSFLGTPLYASPEQIKSEPVDGQSDVYSTAATLYFLLTGQAPFEGGDGAAILARIVSESPAPMRQIRPEIDPLLDRVVLRGLERARAKRWRTLSEFKAALIRCLPERLNAGGVGLRFTSHIVDQIIVAIPMMFVMFLIIVGAFGEAPQMNQRHGRPTGWEFVGMGLSLLYYGVLDGLLGFTIGKWLLRLRICQTDGASAPGLRRGFLRSFIFHVLVNLGAIVWLFLWYVVLPHGASMSELSRSQPVMYTFVTISAPLGGLIGIVAVCITMRTGNGFRGLHEWLSGTRVVLLPVADTNLQAPLPQGRAALSHPEGCPKQIGPFAIEGAVEWTNDVRVARGRDDALNRSVWVWLRSDRQELSESRRAAARTSRLRWLSSGEIDGQQWEAFVGPPVQSITDWIAEIGPLTWAQARPLLEQLSNELVESKHHGDGSESLDLRHVWMRGDGTLQLLDFPIGNIGAPQVDSQPAALRLVRHTAKLLLEGRFDERTARKRVRAPLPGYAADIMRRLMGRDFSPQSSIDGFHYPTIDAFRAELMDTRTKPAEVGRVARLSHLILQGLLLMTVLPYLFAIGPIISIFGLFVSTIKLDEFQYIRSKIPTPHQVEAKKYDAQQMIYARNRSARLQSMFWFAREFSLVVEPQILKQMAMERRRREKESPALSNEDWRKLAKRHISGSREFEVIQIVFAVGIGTMLIWPVFWILWAFLVRGGLTLRITGLTLVRHDGRRAARWQCAWRAFLFWLPVAVLLGGSAILHVHYWQTWQADDGRAWMPICANVMWYAASVYLVGSFALALWRPSRAPHDWAAGTVVMPR